MYQSYVLFNKIMLIKMVYVHRDLKMGNKSTFATHLLE